VVSMPELLWQVRIKTARIKIGAANSCFLYVSAIKESVLSLTFRQGTSRYLVVEHAAMLLCKTPTTKDIVYEAAEYLRSYLSFDLQTVTSGCV
jgi:hypothetical protein